MTFDAMYETGWALDEENEDRAAGEAYRRWQRDIRGMPLPGGHGERLERRRRRGRRRSR